MSEGVRNLIDAIVAGDNIAVNDAFNSEMATRISSRLDDMRVSVAQNMFKEEQVDEETDQELDLTEEQIDAILDSITEEDMVEIDALTEEQVEEAYKCSEASCSKIAEKAGKKYGSAEKGRKVAGAVVAKLREKY